VARQDELAWLCERNGDRLVVGQPGSGKTFLLFSLACEHSALFVVDKDMGRIANGLRSQSPATLIVDDAHMDLNFLSRLRRWREEMGASFVIAASSWPGEEGDVASILNLSQSQIRDLQPLDRGQIVEVIKSVGLAGPDRLVREIVDQARGRPGLAVTLAHLCLQGDVQRVALGDALIQDIQVTFEPLLGSQAVAVLAAFAIAGNSGIAMRSVADALAISLVEARNIVTGLAAGGIIEDVAGSRLCVWPRRLRYALVRDVFFAGATSLDYRPLVESAVSLLDVVRSLMGALASGANVPLDYLVDLMEKAPARTLHRQYGWEHVEKSPIWRDFASLGETESRIVLARHPEMVLDVAAQALHNAPEDCIPLLLAKAIADTGELHPHPNHPLRTIDDWVKNVHPGTGEGVTRRARLFGCVADWITSGKDLEVGLRALNSVFSPSVDTHTVDPGMGMTVTFSRGALSKDELDEILTLWPRAVEILNTAEMTDWKHIISIIQTWAYPDSLRPDGLHESLRSTMHAGAAQMLTDLVQLASDRPGVLLRARGIVKHLDLDLEIQLDPEFLVLFPQEDPQNWRAAHEGWAEAARDLASRWAREDPQTVAERLTFFDKEALLAGVTWPRLTPFVSQEIARHIVEVEAWTEALIDAGAPGDAVEPFLQKSLSMGKSESHKLLDRCLDDEILRGSAVSVALRTSDLPTELLQKTASFAGQFPQLVEGFSSRNEIPECTLRTLLQHEDSSVASATAIGEWLSEPKGDIRKSLQEDWRKAIVNCEGDGRQDHWLAEILKNDVALAHEWLDKRIPDEKRMWWERDKVLEAAASVLPPEQRAALLAKAPVAFRSKELVKALVGADVSVYEQFLAEQGKERLHTVALEGDPDEPLWVEMARAALDAGYSPRDVASASFSGMRSWSGNESDMWSELAKKFESLSTHGDERVQTVAQLGQTMAKEQQDNALARERHEAIYGFE